MAQSTRVHGHLRSDRPPTSACFHPMSTVGARWLRVGWCTGSAREVPGTSGAGEGRPRRRGRTARRVTTRGRPESRWLGRADRIARLVLARSRAKPRRLGSLDRLPRHAPARRTARRDVRPRCHRRRRLVPPRHRPGRRLLGINRIARGVAARRRVRSRSLTLDRREVWTPWHRRRLRHTLARRHLPRPSAVRKRDSRRLRPCRRLGPIRGRSGLRERVRRQQASAERNCERHGPQQAHRASRRETGSVVAHGSILQPCIRTPRRAMDAGSAFPPTLGRAPLTEPRQFRCFLFPLRPRAAAASGSTPTPWPGRAPRAPGTRGSTACPAAAAGRRARFPRRP